MSKTSRYLGNYDSNDRVLYDPYQNISTTTDTLLGDRQHDVFLSLTSDESTYLSHIVTLFMQLVKSDDTELSEPFNLQVRESLYKKIETVCGLTHLNIDGDNDTLEYTGNGCVQVVEAPYLNFLIHHVSRVPTIIGAVDTTTPLPLGFTTVTRDALDAFKFNVQYNAPIKVPVIVP